MLGAPQRCGVCCSALLHGSLLSGFFTNHRVRLHPASPFPLSPLLWFDWKLFGAGTLSLHVCTVRSPSQLGLEAAQLPAPRGRGLPFIQELKLGSGGRFQPKDVNGDSASLPSPVGKSSDAVLGKGIAIALCQEMVAELRGRTGCAHPGGHRAVLCSPKSPGSKASGPVALRLPYYTRGAQQDALNPTAQEGLKLS